MNGTEVLKEKKLAETKQTAAQKYRAMLDEANKHREAAVSELKVAIQDLIVDLNELGFNYRLTEGGGSASKGEKKPRPVADKDCPICKFRTSPPHDGRNKLHRDQGENKKPLTAKQLEEAGLAKV
jgi:hypothetical protein